MALMGLYFVFPFFIESQRDSSEHRASNESDSNKSDSGQGEVRQGEVHQGDSKSAPQSEGKEGEELLIYAYSSFAASWGPGPKLKEKFEALCQCQIKIVDGEDSRRLLNRLQMNQLQAENQRIRADLVIGINQWDVDEAVDTLGFMKPKGSQVWSQWLKDQKIQINEKLLSSGMVPFDWGLLSFNTKKENALAQVKNLEAFLVALPEQSLTLSDPRTSAPGWVFLNWLVKLKGEDGAFEYLKKLSPKISVIAGDWSGSYGLFQKGQAKAVFSYVTSPLYHLIEEKDNSYTALSLEEALPLHLELAGVLKSCVHCERAQEFLDFLLTDGAQRLIMEKNYMFPVNGDIAKGTPWEIKSALKVQPVESSNSNQRKHLLDRWSQWIRNR